MASLLDQGFASVGVAPAITAGHRAPAIPRPAPSSPPVQPSVARQPTADRIAAADDAAKPGLCSTAASRLANICRRSPRPKPRRWRRAAAPGARALGHPARRLPRRGGGREGGARCRQPGDRQGQAAADCRARQGKRALPRPPAHFTPRERRRLRRTAQERDRLLGGAPTAKGRGALRLGSRDFRSPGRCR